ncbi:hypothetical protein E4U41_007220, partial [Claviceps citrina]
MTSGQTISVEYRGRVAMLTISNEKKLGALNHDGYYALGAAMNEIAGHDEVVTTVMTGTGRFFSAGADVSVAGGSPAHDIDDNDNNTNNTNNNNDDDDPAAVHRRWLQTFVPLQLYVTRAFAHHPKVLVAALNGPVVGLSAALVGWADFIYCTPQTFLLTPFSSLGL